ncbi:MAG: SDR family oxidoreductase [Bacteroidota bacterium]
MDINLNGKNALVCGSSKGIGKATAFELAKLGANVTLVSRSPLKMTDIIHEMEQYNGQHHDFLVADFTNPEDLRKKVRGLVATKPIHILINNTGGPPAGPILKAKPKDFIAAYTNHLICNQLLVQLVVPRMKQEEYGRIVNIISTSVKAPIDNLGVSNTTRAAVANWAKTLSNELGPDGITVNNVLPGFTDTDRLRELIGNIAENQKKTVEEVASNMEQSVPLKRFAKPSEIGSAAAFLSTPAAAYITGTNITVDGGRTRSL